MSENKFFTREQAVDLAEKVTGFVKARTYDKDETDALLANKAGSDDVYTKTEADELLADKADAADIYTKEETYSIEQIEDKLDDYILKAGDTKIGTLSFGDSGLTKVSESGVNLYAGGGSGGQSAKYNLSIAQVSSASRYSGGGTGELGIGYLNLNKYTSDSETNTKKTDIKITSADITQTLTDNSVATEYTYTYPSKTGTLLVDADLESNATIEDEDIVYITDAAQANYVELIGNIETEQSFNGYDKPWSGGQDVNITPFETIEETTVNGITYKVEENNHIVISGTAEATVRIPITMTYACSLAANKLLYHYWEGTDTRSGEIHIGALVQNDESTGYTVVEVDQHTISAGSTSARVIVGIFIEVPSDCQIDFDCNYMLSKTYNDGYRPFANICHVDGYSGITVYDYKSYQRLEHSLSERTQGNVTITPLGNSEFKVTVVGGTSSMPFTFGCTSFTVYDGDDAYIKLNNSYANASASFALAKNGVAVESYAFTNENQETQLSAAKGVTINTFIITIPEIEGDLEYTFKVEIESKDSATSKTISWEEEVGNVYDGYFNFNTGVLTLNKACYESYNGEELTTDWISDRDDSSSIATPSTGAQVIYELETPITYQLTPTKVEAFENDNAVYVNTGSIQKLTYLLNTILGKMQGEINELATNIDSQIETWINENYATDAEVQEIFTN